jgi:outer membrane protein insertion porin family
MPDQNNQTTLRQITFKNNRAVRSEYLRKQIPLRDRHTFDPKLLRVGLDRIRDAYEEFGYIQATCTPEIIRDDQTRSISVSITVNEGHPFLIRSITVLGLDGDMTKELADMSLKRGSIYNQQLAELFFKRHAPSGIARSPRSSIHLQMNETKETVAVTIDLRRTDAVPK